MNIANEGKKIGIFFAEYRFVAVLESDSFWHLELTSLNASFLPFLTVQNLLGAMFEINASIRLFFLYTHEYNTLKYIWRQGV
jgi:hypothetical protein